MANKQQVTKASLDAICTEDGAPIKDYFASADVSDKFSQIQDALNEIINEYDGKIEDVEDTASSLKSSMTTLTKSLKALDTTVTQTISDLTDRITTLEANYAALETRVSALEPK